MKSFPLFLCFCLVSISVSAQSKFSLGLELFPHASWEHDPFIEELSPRLSKHAGLAVGYQLGEHFRFQSGISYTEFGNRYELEGSELRWGLQHDGNGGFNPDIPNPEPLIGNIESSTIHRFLEVPLRLTYISSGDQTRFYISTGIAPRVHIRSVSKVRHEKPDNGGTDRSTSQISSANFDRIQFSVLGSAGVEIELAGTTLFAGPRIQFQQLRGTSDSINGPHHFEAGYFQLGLEMGVRL